MKLKIALEFRRAGTGSRTRAQEMEGETLTRLAARLEEKTGAGKNNPSTLLEHLKSIDPRSVGEFLDSI